ncbi:hypothetical protein DPMN_108750 [Dreissena polymorpha]|uniref:Uncharacterized protein n=1 Tax=Dreissena polymorpha TaxID=45954 RepID=A0A9D4K9G2_DREPO|nr:hypothetical protein DPMN_108750 [Dreissena polymorpha]
MKAEECSAREEHVWCSSDVRVLIAGDSNVHRLKSACPPNARIDFLPVSGAQDRRKVNRIAGDSNAHRIKDILPDDIAVKCLPISDENM